MIVIIRDRINKTLWLFLGIREINHFQNKILSVLIREHKGIKVIILPPVKPFMKEVLRKKWSKVPAPHIIITQSVISLLYSLRLCYWAKARMLPGIKDSNRSCKVKKLKSDHWFIPRPLLQRGKQISQRIIPLVPLILKVSTLLG